MCHRCHTRLLHRPLSYRTQPIEPEHQSCNLHGSLLVRRLMAGNPSLTPDSQAVLAGDAEYPVRYELARNPSLDFRAQEVLSTDTNRYVRSALARNPSVSSDIAARLALDEDVLVRSAAVLVHVPQQRSSTETLTSVNA